MAGEWLILHGGALGDLVLTIQLALALVEVQHAGRLHVVSRTDPGDLSGCHPRITRQSLEGLGAHWLYMEESSVAPEALQRVVRGSHVLNALSGLDSVVHRRLSSFAPARLFSFDPRPRAGLKTHITQQWRRKLEQQGLLLPKCTHQRVGAARLHLAPELATRGRATLTQQGCGDRGILLHPGSGGRAKCWPLPCFVEVARQMRNRGVPGCFLIGPAEEECWSADDVAALRRELPLIVSPEPNELLAILAAARVFVSNDAGPAHLAALVGTPTITIFGPTSADVWQPLGPDVQVLQGDPDAFSSGWGIDVEQVLALAGRFA